VLLFLYLLGCRSAETHSYSTRGAFVIDKPDAVKEYFAQNNWNFPFQMDSLQPLRFGEHPDSLQILADSSKFQSGRMNLFVSAVKYFISLGIDSSCAYRFSNASVYGVDGSIHYRLGVQTYKNNRDPKAGCECAEIDSGRVHGYRCLMQFKIVSWDSLIYEGCVD
jgi:hypothetical protein